MSVIRVIKSRRLNGYASSIHEDMKNACKVLCGNLKEDTIEKTTCGREVNNKIYLKGRCRRKWIKFIWIYGPVIMNKITQGCTNPVYQFVQESKFCTVTPNICGPSRWKLTN